MPSLQYQYKKQYETSKGHYHVVPDNLEQLHLKEATELQSQVSWSSVSHSSIYFQCQTVTTITPRGLSDME